MTDFAKARRQRLADQPNDNTTPEDALGLAGDWLEEHPSDGPALVVIEKENGGVAVFSANATLGECICMLEKAKLTLLRAEER